MRELANAVERAVILSRGGALLPAAFQQHLGHSTPAPLQPAPGPAAPPAGSAPPAAENPFDLDALEHEAIRRALEATGGNRVRAAKLLGISERTLRNKLNPKEPPALPEPPGPAPAAGGFGRYWEQPRLE